MRGYEMSSASTPGGLLRPLGGSEASPPSPLAAWQFHSHVTKQESGKDVDSGISGSDQSSSPGSDYSMQQPDPIITPPLKSEYDMGLYRTSSNSPSCSSWGSSEPDTTSGHNEDDPLKKPKVNESSIKDLNESVGTPGLIAHERPRPYKCRRCDFSTTTKEQYWTHSSVHISEDKLLKCSHPLCPFVTEYKHHLKYHLSKHSGLKPFKCDKCSYSCTSKPMLKSHLKSHSNVYQYRCADCNYATKYCHSLKLHLRKYNHQPGIILNPDGSPKQSSFIDVYGNRRGPKSKPYMTPPKQQPFMSPEVVAFIQNQLLLSNIELLAKTSMENKALDLSQSTSTECLENAENKKNDTITTVLDNVEAVYNEPKDENINNKNSCQFCQITFADDVLYTMHMGYHGYDNPFNCKMCGEKCNDKISFFLHVARTSHN